jgi:hypothetical protein
VAHTAVRVRGAHEAPTVGAKKEERVNLDMIAGAAVWLFLGVPFVGFIAWLVAAPFRAAANARRNRDEPAAPAQSGPVWDEEFGTYRWMRRP